MRLFPRFVCLPLLLVLAWPAATRAVATPPTLSVTQANGVMTVSWPQSASGFQLQSRTSFNAFSPWQPVPALAILSNNAYQVTFPMSGPAGFFRLAPAPLTTVQSSSPANGEVGVAVLRETILRFNSPVAANTLISPDQFYAFTSAGTLLTRVELASDGRSASLFYLEPMPGGSTVTVVFDGTGILDQSGRLIDPDGDGKPGGVTTFSFQTFNTAPVANTGVIGYVYASVPVAGGNGVTTNHPLANVTITVDGQEETLRTTTDQNGAFSLNPCPAGRFFVRIDGRTSMESQYPSGAYYPFVGKPWEATAGVTNNLAGGTGLIYLPLVAAGTLQPTSLTTNTTITFPPSVLAANPYLAGVSITIPANSLFSDDGTRGGMIGIAPVSPDRLPSPLPPGVHPALVFTIQTDGADNFDQPAPVRFPNLPDPVTGKLPPPGAKTALWGFNHKAGRWEIQGPSTVSPDGLFVDSDPGYGVRQPGWEIDYPGNDGSGGGGGPRPPPPGGPPNPNNPNNPCNTELKSLESASIQCAAGVGITILTGIITELPGLGCAFSIAQGVIGSVADCNIDPSGCKVTIAQNGINAALGCIPVIGAGFSTASSAAGAAKSCAIDEAVAYGNYQNCKTANGLNNSIHREGRPKYFGDAIPNNIWDEQIALLQGFADLLTDILGDVAWTEVEVSDTPALLNFYSVLLAAIQPGSDGGAQITPAEQASLLVLPLPANLSITNATNLLNRLNQIAAGTLPDGEFDLATVLQDAQQLQATVITLQSRGWVTTYDAFTRGLTLPFVDENQAQQGQPQFTEPLHYRLVDFGGAPNQYGVLNANGQIDNLLLTENHLYELDYADLQSYYVGHTIFQATGPGLSTVIPKADMRLANPTDSNGDGIPDEVELVLPDGPVNGDGFPDGMQILNGKLVPGPAPTGIIGSAASSSAMTQIAVSGTVALVAEPNGVAVYDISADQPVMFTTLPLAGAVSSVALSGTLGVVTMDRAGIAVIDVSNPLSPRVARYISIDGATTGFLKVVTAGNLAYAVTGTTLYLFDIVAGQLLDQRSINTTAEQAQPQDLAVSGGYVYLLTNYIRSYPGDIPGQHHLHKILVDQLIGADAATLNLAGSNYVADVPTHIAATPGFVYLSGLNATTNAASSGLAVIADGTNGLQMIAPPTSALGALCLAANGSGTLLAGGTNLSILDVRNPQAGAVVVTNFALPAPAKALTVGYGRAYVADNNNGLQVVAYYQPDTKGQPPSIALGANFPLTPAAAPPGQSVVFSAVTSDDVQVWRVEFYLNGALATQSGTAPFDFWLTTPATNNSSFTIQAKAVDTGLNSTWSPLITVQVSASSAPPAVTNVSPAPASVNAPGVAAAQALFKSALDPGSVTTSSLQVVSAGPDGILGTADDAPVAGGASYSGNPPVITFKPTTPFAPGLYGVTLGTGVADANGNHLSSSYTWDFTVQIPDQWTTNAAGQWFDPRNWSASNPPPPGGFAVINEPNPLDTITFTGGSASLTSLMSTVPLVWQSGTFSLAGPSSVSTNVTFFGDTLYITNRLDIGGQLDWESGLIDGGGVITAYGLNLPANSHRIGKITLVNRGLAVWQAALFQGISIGDPGTVLVNAPTGVFETQGRTYATWSGGFGPPYPQFNNQGLFHLMNGTNTATTFNGIDFNNSGVVQIDSGTLNLSGNGGVSSGAFNIAAGALLQLNSGNETTPASSIQGPGVVEATAGSSTLNGVYNVTGGTTAQGGGLLVVNGDIQNTGPIVVNSSGRMTLSGTSINLSVPIVVNGGFLYLNSFSGSIQATSLTMTNFGTLLGTADVTVSGALLATNAAAYGPGKLILQGPSTVANFSLYGFVTGQSRPLDNYGYLSLLGNLSAGPAQIRNLPGATIDCKGDYQISQSVGTTLAFVNSGTLLKSSGTGFFEISAVVHNDGLIVANAGTIYLAGGVLQTGGETRLAGGGLEGGTFTMEAGMVTGSGAVQFTQVTNSAAVVSPGLTNAPVGSLHFTDQFNEGPGGTISIYILNNSATGYSYVAAGGGSTLDGTLTVTLDPGYQPVLGDTFPIVQCSHLTGQFANLILPSLAGGLSFNVGYGQTGVTLTVVSGQ